VNTVAHHRIGDRSHPEFCGHAKPEYTDEVVVEGGL
jgi:hypothetical protein